jgi:hypothetical protein
MATGGTTGHTHRRIEPPFLLNYQLGCHVIVMRAADYSALYRIFALGFWRKRNGGRATRLHRLFNSKIGNVKSVLYVGRSHVQRNRLPALHSNNGGLNRVLAHDYVDVLSGTFALVASCREEKET